MKKILVLLTVALGIFGFAAGSFAQDICTTCNKCEIGNIPCGCQGQGGTTTCDYFDFETAYGYIPGTREGNCKAIFNICDCDDAGTTFVAGHRVGIRLTILVNGLYGQRGAYWSAPGSTNVQFGMFSTSQAACAATAYTSAFGPGKWYRVNAAGQATTEVLSLSSATSGAGCAVALPNQATQIITDPDQGYTITATDETNKLSRWWINIPEMRIDPCVLYNGELIQVKIETLDQSTGGICADCVAVCECIVDIAYVCPSGTSSASCLFPYFSSTTAPDDITNFWWNGIAITNTSAYDGVATLTVTQTDGKTGTYDVNLSAGEVFVSTLAAIPFSGTGLGGKPCWITVSTSFPSVDGMGLMADSSTGESMGYLCRKDCK